MCKECGMAYSFFFNAQFHKKDCAVGITAEKIQKALEGDLEMTTKKETMRCPVCTVGKIAETQKYGIRFQCVDDGQGWNDTRTVKDYCGMSYHTLAEIK